MQDSDPLTAELVVDAAAAVSPAISPDGRLVAYAVIASGGRGGCPQGSIWITAADGSAAPRRLTDGTAQDLSPKWAPDSTSVFFTSDREEQGTAQLQRIRLDGGEAETRPAGVAASPTTVRSWTAAPSPCSPRTKSRKQKAMTPRSGAGTFR